MAKILLVEDESSIRKLLRYDLQQGQHEVVSMDNGEEALQVARNEEFDVLLLDWMLPGKSGVEIAQILRDEGNKSIIIMLTAKGEEEDILDAFEAGVDDYMTKPFSPRVLTARINAHLRRLVLDVEDSRVLHVGNTVIDADARSVVVAERVLDFTKKEFDLLVFLVKHKDVVLTRDQILNEIWDFGYDGDTRIVDVHVHKIRGKMEHSDIIIESLRGIGYVAKTE